MILDLLLSFVHKSLAVFRRTILNKNNISLKDYLQEKSSEFTWYGEWLLKNNIPPIYPSEPLFKVFHYEKQFTDFSKQNFSLQSLEENYLVIVYNPISHENKKKKFFIF